MIHSNKGIELLDMNTNRIFFDEKYLGLQVLKEKGRCRYKIHSNKGTGSVGKDTSKTFLLDFLDFLKQVEQGNCSDMIHSNITIHSAGMGTNKSSLLYRLLGLQLSMGKDRY